MCTTSREAMKQFREGKFTGFMDAAVIHIAGCRSCADWFRENTCSQISAETGEDELIGHGMLHESLGTECPNFPPV